MFKQLSSPPNLDRGSSVSSKEMADWIDADGVLGLVSIIVPTYNRANLLLDVLHSIANQSYKSIEVIVVDDGSTDDTLIRVKEWASSSGQSVKILRQVNAGPGSARNHGLRSACGEFIYFIDSDDLIFPTAIEDMVSAVILSGMPYCLAGIQNADVHSVVDPLDFEGVPKYSPSDIVSSRWMIHGALYRRSAILVAGGFGEAVRYGEDAEFHWRIVATNGPCHILYKFVGLRRKHQFGHLSVGRAGPDTFRQTDAIITRFAEWAYSDNLLNYEVSRAILRYLMICRINLGLSEEWKRINDGILLIDKLSEFDKVGGFFVKLLTSLNVQYYYLVLSATLVPLRAFMEGVRRLRYRIQADQWG